MKKYFVPNSINVSVHRKIRAFSKRIIQQEPEFKNIFKQTKEYILELVIKNEKDRKDFDVVFFPLSGSGSIESLLSSINGKSLCVSNGEYGRRMFDSLSIYNKSAQIMESDSDGMYSLNFNQIKNVLEENDFKYLTMVHVEESSGIINDIEKIGKYCGENNTKFLVDCCASIGGAEIDMKKMGITALVGTAEKNIEALPGMSFIVAKTSFFESLNKKSKTSYLSLKRQYKFQKRENRIRFTIPMYSFISLNLELARLQDETVKGRFERYTKYWETLLDRMNCFEFDPVVPEEVQSRFITAFNAPIDEDYSFEDLSNFLMERGFMIYPGKINDMETFRISTIGDIKEYDIPALVNHIHEFVQNSE